MIKILWGVLCLLCVSLAQASPALTVATDELPPFRFAGQDGQLQGLDIDILQRLEQMSGIALQVKRLPLDQAFKQMQSGQVDLMIGLVNAPERAEFIDYLQPSYYRCWPAFYGLPAQVASIDQYSHLLGKKVGYVLNATYFEPFDSDTRIDKQGVKTEESLLQMVLSGDLPMMIGSDCQVDYLLGQKKGVTLVKAPYSPARPVNLYLGMSRHSPNQALRQPLMQALQTLVSSGQIRLMASQYYP